MNKRNVIVAFLLGALVQWPAGVAWAGAFKRRTPFCVTVYEKLPPAAAQEPLSLLRNLPASWARRVTAASTDTGLAVKIEEAHQPPVIEWVVETMERVARLSRDGKEVTFDSLPEGGEAAAAWNFAELNWLGADAGAEPVQWQGTECLLYREKESGGRFALLARKTKLPVAAGGGGMICLYAFPDRVEGLAMPDLVKARVAESLAYFKKLHEAGAMPPLR